MFGLYGKVWCDRRWQAVFIMFAFAFSFVLCSCDDDVDDIDIIFNDKKMKITGCVYNGVGLNGERVKEFYSNPYYVEFFSSGAFQCVLTDGSDVSGYWSAGGEERKVKFDVRSVRDADKTTLSRQVFEILKNATRYSGDSNVMKIYKDSGNYLILNAKGI